jgi:glycosyltransferase involved in cell wall biosynthesis
LQALEKQAIGRPVFTTFHSKPRFCQQPLKVFHRFAWHQVARRFQQETPHWAVVHNPFTRDALVASGFSASKVVLIPIAVAEKTLIQTPVKPALRQQVLERLQVKPGDTVLGIVGFINRLKRHVDLLEALAQLPTSYKLLIIGGSKDRTTHEEAMVNRIYELGLQQRVLITGVYEEAALPSFLSCVDMGVAPYGKAFETSSGAITLLMTSGIPIVASDCAGFEALNREFGCLALFEAENVDALREAIVSLRADTARSSQLVEAIARYREQCGEQAVAVKTLQAYQTAFRHSRGQIPANLLL